MRSFISCLLLASASAFASGAQPDDDAKYAELELLRKARPLRREDAPITVATPKRKKEAVPRRFGAPLKKPSDAVGYLLSDPKDAPPVRHVADLVCLGDAGMRKRWLSTLESEAATAIDLTGGYGDWLIDCEREEACRFFAASARSSRQKAVREHLWELATNCRSAALADVFLDPTTPNAQVMEWLSRLRHESGLPEWSSRYGDAFKRHVATVKLDPRRIYDPIVTAAETFAGWGDPRALEVLLSTHGSMKDPARKALLAIGMSASTDPRATELFTAACREPANAERCQGRVAEPPRALEQLIEDEGFDPARWLASNRAREKELRAALHACDDAKERAVSTCLSHLARLDWTAARAQASRVKEKSRALAAEGWSTNDAPIWATLEKFESHEALVSWARERKLIGANAPRRAVTLAELLSSSGRAVTVVEPEEGLPPEHQHVLRVIASAAGLKDVSFDQAGCKRRKGWDWRRCELIAWSDGLRWSLEAVADDDRYDLHQCVSFANALLAHRKAPVRAVLLADGYLGTSEPAIAILPPEVAPELVRDRLVLFWLDDLAESPPEPETQDAEE